MSKEKGEDGRRFEKEKGDCSQRGGEEKRAEKGDRPKKQTKKRLRRTIFL
jgi:hypothetical protein